MLLKLLIHKLKIFNGDRDSALPMLKLMNQQDLLEVENATNYDIQRINLKNEMILADKIFMKYKIMIIRHKISFMASLRLNTIVELFLR